MEVENSPETNNGACGEGAAAAAAQAPGLSKSATGTVGDTFVVENAADFQFSKPSEIRVRKVQVGAGGSLRINVTSRKNNNGNGNMSESDTASVTSEGGRSSSSSNVKCGISTDGNETMISIMGNILDELERNCVKRRTEVVLPDGFLSTPLHVLKSMAEDFNMKLHSEMFMMHNPEKGNRMARVELYVGNFRGVGQAPRRKLAFQMAAVDLLEKVKLSNGEIKLRPYALFPGMRINPAVYTDLNYICTINDLEFPKFEGQPQGEYADGPMFTVQCRVGRLTATEKSDDRCMAKRLAAAKMYKLITGQDYPLMQVLWGNQCIGFRQLECLGIKALCSPWKQEWLKENRIAEDGTPIIHEEDPDDGDFELGGVEDLIEDLKLDEDILKRGKPTGLTRVVINDLGPSTVQEIKEEPEDMQE